MKYKNFILLLGLGIMSSAIAFGGIDEDFTNRRKTVVDKTVFAPFEKSDLKGIRLDAMKFMYAYMPLPDLTGYSADFHQNNVDVTLRAREEMPWGKSVPQREWLHFVLPVRVNNESLDNSREVFYEELRDRVKGLSMKDAILEVNHWCHEKVSYKPSDARTSNPLSTVSQAIGRCGEESTFTVAALRSVGIPARQVYTPRWAHTDDNHAWVEAWADGEWYFLGACEPAPVLDMAWFNAPASRGMLMTTNVFGSYDGPEEQLEKLPLVTTINVTSKYAPVDTLNVRVVDVNGQPVENAKVNFSLYNYAEFYPVASKTTDKIGHASLTSGLGDMVLWASDGTNFGWAQGRPGETTVTVILDKDKNYNGNFDMTIVPPTLSGKLPSPSEAQIAANDRRLQYEDSIRNSYIASFASKEKSDSVASTLGIDAARLWDIIGDARGNSHNLLHYIASLSPQSREYALKLLQAVTEKDRRDINTKVIDDNITNLAGNRSSDYYINYVLNPRISTEGLTPYKAYLAQAAGKKLLNEFAANPLKLVDWVTKNITIESNENPKQTIMDPRAVWRERRSDSRSRNIFFVALARTAGIPARIDPITGKTQYMPDNESIWQDVDFTQDLKATMAGQGVLEMPYTQVGRMENPKYYFQFSISKLNDGLPRQLEFDETAGWKEMQADTTKLDAGQYLMLTGQRMADGSVMTHGEIFTITPETTTSVPLVLRQDPTGVQVIGNLNAENIYHDFKTDTDKSILSTTGRGYYVLGIIKPSDEPSAHALNDISVLKEEFEKTGIPMLILFPDASAAERFDFSHFSNLPTSVTFGIDNDGVSLNEIVTSLNLPDSQLPVFVVADSFNRIVYVSQGYNIGLGDKIADILSKIK